MELGYAVGRVPARLLRGRRPAQHRLLRHPGEGPGRHLDADQAHARQAARDSTDRIVLKGRSRFGRLALDASDANAVNGVRYGIEQYFVPHGEGPRLEALARDKKLAALIAVDASGNAAIKGLLIDGRLQYEEPLL